MIGHLVRSAARGLLHEVGLDSATAVKRANARAEKATRALELSQEERRTFEAQAAESRRRADLVAEQLERTRAAQRQAEQRADAATAALGRMESEHRLQLAELERQVVGLTEGDTSRARALEEQHARELAEIEERHRAELAIEETRIASTLRDVSDDANRLRAGLASALQETDSARKELMMVEVKLEVIEAAVNILDRRTRLMGVLPPLRQHPVLQPRSDDEPAASSDDQPSRGNHTIDLATVVDQ
jgi:hypothetical protein